MKSIFKKAISVICAAAVVATCFSSSMFAFAEDTNVLKDNGTLYWDEAKRETRFTAGLTASTLTDGNIDGAGSNAWQPPKSQDKNISVYIKLDDPVDLEKIVVYGEDANYAFEIKYTTKTVTATDFAGMAAIEYTVLCDNTSVTGTAVTGLSDVTEYVLEGFEKVEGVTALELYTTHGNNDWLKYYEVEGYGAAATTPDPEDPEEPTHTPTYTTGTTNIALASNGGTAVVCSRDGQKGLLNDNSAASAWMALRTTGTDGKKTDKPVDVLCAFGGVTWTTEKTFGSVIIYCRDMNVDYVVQYMDANGKWWDLDASVYSIDKTGTWKPADSKFPVDSTTEQATKTYAVHKITFNKAVKAYGVRAYVGVMGSTNFQMFEFEVYEAIESFSKPALQLQSKKDDDLVDRVVLTNIDRAAISAGKIVKAEYNITRGGKTEPGEVYIYNAWQSVSFTTEDSEDSITITAANEYIGGTDGQSVTGFIFRDLLATDKIDVKFSVVDAPAAE